MAVPHPTQLQTCAVKKRNGNLLDTFVVCLMLSINFKDIFPECMQLVYNFLPSYVFPELILLSMSLLVLYIIGFLPSLDVDLYYLTIFNLLPIVCTYLLNLLWSIQSVPAGQLVLFYLPLDFITTVNNITIIWILLRQYRVLSFQIDTNASVYCIIKL